MAIPGGPPLGEDGAPEMRRGGLGRKKLERKFLKTVDSRRGAAEVIKSPLARGFVRLEENGDPRGAPFGRQ